MPVRVLQIVTTMNRGGLETMLMNYYRHIDRTKVQFDFLVHRQEEGDYEKEILSLGGNVYRVPPLNPFSPGYYKALNSFFSEHRYDVVHSHLDCMSAVPLSVAKRHGVNHRFAHAHNKSQDKDIKYPIKLLFKKFIPIFANRLFACGKEAGDWMFNGKSYSVINNAIDAKEYIFNAEKREKKRRELSLGNSFTVCHIGRFNPQKNHSFIIDVFYEILKLDPQSKLLLVGVGDGQINIQEKVRKLNIENNVLFLGLREDIPDLLMASDAFLFPSLYEGVSLATIEAQASGLPCVFSDQIPYECKVSDSVTFVSLKESPCVWAEHLLTQKNGSHLSSFSDIVKSGYDICNNAKWLEEFYMNKGDIHNE